MYLTGNMDKVPIRIIRELLLENDTYNELIYEKMHTAKCTNCNKELESLFHKQDYIINTIKNLVESIMNDEWKKDGCYYLMSKYHEDENYREFGLCDDEYSNELRLEGWELWKPREDMEYE